MTDWDRHPKTDRDRKAFRRAKFAPEEGRHIRSKKRIKKPFIVERMITEEAAKTATPFQLRWSPPNTWVRWGRYETRDGAEQAAKSMQSNRWGRPEEYHLRIREDE